MQKKKYYFDNGYGLVPTAKAKECRERLIKVISPRRNTTFYAFLSQGVNNIRLPLYEAITEVIASYGVARNKIWRIETVE